MAARGAAVEDALTGGGVSPGDRVRVLIRALASSGAGVGSLPDGRVVFVHRTVPGDVADVEVLRLRARWAEARLLEVHEAGAGRVEPPCPLYDACGGCAVQHLAYPEQLAWKGRFVSDALDRIGGRAGPPPAVTPSPEVFRYRNRVTFTVRRVSSSRTVAGFHALREPDRIVDVGSECLLPEPAIVEAWGALRVAWRRGALPLPPGRELRVTIRAVAGGVVFVVKGGAAGWDPAALLAAVPGVTGVWHHAGGSPGPVRLAGEDVHEAWAGDRFAVGGHAFLQVNRRAAEGLFAHVLSRAGAGPTAVDAYCGVGVYGRALARKGWRVQGIDLDADACAAARDGAPEGFAVVHGAVEEHLPGTLPADLVIVNPPRTGLHEWIPGILAHHRPPRVVYVSCDPATLARDAARLGAGFALTSLAAFDLFPQTAHVETVAVFQTEGSA